MLPLYRQELSAEEAWPRYQALDDFKGVVFEQFKEKLAYHRKAVLKKTGKASSESKAFALDIKQRPPEPPDEEMEWFRNLFRRDIEAETDHNRKLDVVRQLRPEYAAMEKKMGSRKFKELVYQERLCKKFINHLKASRDAETNKPPGSQKREREEEEARKTKRAVR